MDQGTAEEATRQALPALLGGIEANTADPGGAESFASAVRQHDNDLVEGGVNLDDVDENDGDRIVGHVFGDQRGQVVRQLGTTGGASTTSDLMGKLLPILAPIVMAYLAKRLGGGAAAGGQAGGIGDLLGSILGGMAGQQQGGQRQGRGSRTAGRAGRHARRPARRPPGWPARRRPPRLTAAPPRPQSHYGSEVRFRVPRNCVWLRSAVWNGSGSRQQPLQPHRRHEVGEQLVARGRGV